MASESGHQRLGIGNMVALAIRTADDRSKNDKRRLVEIVSRLSLLCNTQMRLASGASSTFYFDMKPTLFDPEGLTLVSRLALGVARWRNAQIVGGLELGAVPLVAGIVQASFADGQRPISGFFVRKESKQHGTMRFVEGLGKGVTLSGRLALVVDDVTTTGGSVMKAVHAARKAGCIVNDVLTIVDRCEGATENLEKEGVNLLSLTSASEYKISL